MDKLVIDGGRALRGEVDISGSKNASLPILIACLLSDSKSRITNVPNLSDTRFLLELFTSFGIKTAFFENEVQLDCSSISNPLAPYDQVRKMRASVLVLAPLLARHGQAVVSLPGGCAIGSRPVDIHLEGLMALGASIEVHDGYIHAKLERGRFFGAQYSLPLPSVGATEQLVLAAVLAKGESVLKKVATEPEIVELCNALNNAGAKISGQGSSTLTIEGVSRLNGLHHFIKPDRIEAGTYIAIAAATKSHFRIKNVCFEDLANVIERFARAQVRCEQIDFNPATGLSHVDVFAPQRLVATDVETAAHPGFPTDMQAQFMAAMTLAKGECTIFERVFENRMMHVPELCRMGANIKMVRGAAKIIGQESLNGAPVMATDLRASASLVVAALSARGRSEIRRVYHLDRGYESLEKKLSMLGACISRVHQQET